MQARREWTREWWETFAITDTLVTSPAVLAELSRTPEPKRSDCLGLLGSLPALEMTEEADELVRLYIEHKLMPDDTEGDAMRLALATLHEGDMLVSWNCQRPPPLPFGLRSAQAISLRSVAVTSPTRQIASGSSIDILHE